MKLSVTILIFCGSLPKILVAGDAWQAGATNPVVITTEYIDRLAAEVRANNPALRAARSRSRAAELNAGAVRTWEDPTAKFGVSVFSSQGFTPAEEGDLVYGVGQKLPLWGKPGLNRRVAEAGASISQAESEYRFQQLRSDLTKALLATALAQREVEIGEQDLAWLETTARAVENKYRAGETVIADTLQVQNEAARRNDSLRTERLELAHSRVALDRLLNRDLSSSWPPLRLPPVSPVIPFSEKLLSLALQNEPKLKVLDQEIKQAEASAALTRRTRLPDVSLGVEGRQYSGDGGFREGDFTFSFSLPFFNGAKYRKDHERELEKQKSAEQDREDQVLAVKEELHHLTVDIEAARREALLYQDEISDRAGQALASRLADWESGHGAFRDVLDARRTLLDSELMSARAAKSQNELLAELLLWTGLANVESLTLLANEPPLIPDHENHQ